MSKKTRYIIGISASILLSICIIWMIVVIYRFNYLEELEYNAQMLKNGVYDRNLQILDQYSEMKGLRVQLGIGIGFTMVNLILLFALLDGEFDDKTTI